MRRQNSSSSCVTLLVAIAAAILFAPSRAAAQVIHNFSDADGINPYAALIQANDGNLYGTTSNGGPQKRGTVFRLSADGTFTVLHAFGPDPDGGYPHAALIQATDGNFYGTTQGGGHDSGDGYPGDGTIFRMTMDGSVTVLHAFAGGSGGAVPAASLIQAADGNFYGTTARGGAYDLGTVVRMTADGTVTVLHAFSGNPDGANPSAALIQAADGNFYGTTVFGGRRNCCQTGGTVFRMTPDGTVTVLHAFTDSPDGANPSAALIQATDENFYGTTVSGGSSGGGTVFRMTADGIVTTLHSFRPYGPDGAAPYGGLIQARDGNFYGTTFGRYTYHGGTVFGLVADGTVATLHTFTGNPDGTGPQTALVQATDGTFFGTTVQGGSLDQGAVFHLTLPDLVVSTLLAPTVGGAGATISVRDNIKNKNDYGDAGGSTTELYFSRDAVLDGNDTLIGSRSVRALVAGKHNSGSTSVMIPSDAVPGVYYLIAVADAANAVEEKDESDNTFARKITIGPDLTVAALSAPSSAARGSSIVINDTTKDNGGGSDGTTTITRFYLSVNSVVDPHDLVLGDRTIPILAAGAADAGTTSVVIPADIAPGTYHIVAIADATGLVGETNESNNRKVIGISITP